ncbi:MAG: hypothetical protein C5B56_15235 [Proteobacteria bacterium]|nr:MAG: hypothetical protein C5B56_15235 [Pseudomonadota bacterium]
MEASAPSTGPRGSARPPSIRAAAGRPPKLNAGQRRRFVCLVIAGPEAAGYRTSLWTCRHIVDLIRQHFDVVYHPDHMGRVLRACGFSPQRPQPRAKERDDRRVREWLQGDSTASAPISSFHGKAIRRSGPTWSHRGLAIGGKCILRLMRGHQPLAPASRPAEWRPGARNHLGAGCQSRAGAGPDNCENTATTSS